jgi:hypothetical protein
MYIFIYTPFFLVNIIIIIIGGGHLLENSTFHDFVLSVKGHFVFTGAIWLPTLAHLLRSGNCL